MNEQERSKAIQVGLEMGLNEPISDNLIAALIRQASENKLHYGNPKPLEKLGVEVGGQL